ncbi:MAG: HD domain-containing protein [Bacillota bacterium]|nr:HD domain-containing protein [Bacillota bacterium]
MRRSSTNWRPSKASSLNQAGAHLRRTALLLRLLRLRLGWPRLVPAPVRHILGHLSACAGQPTYLVGGSVRDLLLGRAVHDWDLASAALPDAVRALFPRTLDTGIAHGTVTVVHQGCAVEVTTFRREGPYLDGRHPSSVSFDAGLRDDLARRDFTINAMALGAGGRLHDPFGGLDDLALRRIRAVGDPAARFAEDHLRVMRAFRLAAELGFDLDSGTAAAARACACALDRVAAERLRAELDRILLSPNASWALERLRAAGAIDVLLPELTAGAGFVQNEYHPHDVWTHSVLTCAHIEPVLHLRLAGLLHDAGKPVTLTVDELGRRHFYGHERRSAELAEDIMRRLRYDQDTTRRVVHLIRVHMDLHDLPAGSGDAAVRRVAARVGRENIADLLRLRRADRLAAGKPRAASAGILRLLERLAALERADEALSLSDLRIDGHGVMEATGLPPGPQVGRVLAGLLEAVLDNPEINNPADLARLARILARQRSARDFGMWKRSPPQG